MDFRSHYAFALGYKDGLVGGPQTVQLAAELQEVYAVGYEQGASDDMFGEPNKALLAGQPFLSALAV